GLGTERRPLPPTPAGCLTVMGNHCCYGSGCAAHAPRGVWRLEEIPLTVIGPVNRDPIRFDQAADRLLEVPPAEPVSSTDRSGRGHSFPAGSLSAGGRFPGAPDASTDAAHVPLIVIGAVPAGVSPPLVVQVDGVVSCVRVPPEAGLNHPVLARCVAVRP